MVILLYVLLFSFISLTSSMCAVNQQKTMLSSSKIKNGTTGFPKWDGLVFLQKIGLPAPKGLFVKPYSLREDIEKIIEDFVKISSTQLLVLRPDGKKGIGKTPAGINLNKRQTSEIGDRLEEWSSEGYGVSLVETHNRFDYDLL